MLQNLSVSKKTKKDKAVVFAISDSYSFAVANMILNIETNDPGLISEYVIFSPDISDVNKNALLKLVPNIVFKDYKENYFFERAPKVPRDAPFIVHWSYISMAHFEIFDLLDEYKHILYLDADMFVYKSIANLFNSKPLAWRASAADFYGFVKGYIEMPTGMTMPNAGLVYVNDKLPNYKTLTNACYDILCDGYGKMRTDRAHDEMVLGILNYKYSLDVQLLPMVYNCPFGGRQTNKAIILHFMGPLKIWKNPIYLNFFPAFKQNYDSFIKAGGRPYEGDLCLGNGYFSEDFGLLESFFTVKYILMWKDLLGNLFLMLPEGVVQSDILSKPYVRFYLKQFDMSLFYEISVNEGKNSKYISFNVSNSAILLSEKVKSEIKHLGGFLGFEYTENNGLVSIRKLVKDQILINEFLLFITITKPHISNLLLNAITNF